MEATETTRKISSPRRAEERSPSETTQETGRGKTYIADEVVSVIARIAAEQVEGIHRIGEPSLRSFIPSLVRHHGVDAEVGLREAAADVEVVVEYGYPIRDVADAIRASVIDSVEHMTGNRVVEVNVHVVDVHVPRIEPKSRRELR
jgi:uncharacterized alkaline shock family protein YloU